ncbi:helix-turn-helix domain-containing protein [Dehalobacter sp. DCM]|uniref:helix-turn-helix transcriptional regulator n=1 Tax=Dehalobacter sp. DCM TaxID=2907827 RepID=UPI00308201C6|nr:helix-turn-helix domain-containing protein [Dehalobacter sp. DCM]
MTVKNRLRKIRLTMDITQTEMAQLLEVTQQQYNRYERQKTQPSLEIALRIEKKLNQRDIFYLAD